MQGGRLQSNKTLESSFNLQVIDCEKRIQKKYILLWDNGENYYRTSEETEWVPFVSLDHRDTFSVTEEFGKNIISP